MSDTPRTDIYEGSWASTWPDGVTIFEHARTLEREVDALKAANEQSNRDWNCGRKCSRHNRTAGATA